MLRYCADKKSSDKKTSENLEKSGLMDLDDTLRGLLLKNIYKIEFKDEVLREIMGDKGVTFGPGEIIGIFGSSGSGKSMLIQHIVSNLILPKVINGEDLRVYYIDTDNGFFTQVFVEKHLIPTIEKRMIDLESKSEKTYIHETIKYNKNKQIYLSNTVKLCLKNLNVIQISDLLDLLCVIREITLKSYDLGVFVIDSLNFWNIDINSLVITNRRETSYYNHIFGYYTNRNTIFNSIYSLIKYITHSCGYMGIISINDCESLHTLNFKTKNANNIYSEELVELENLYYLKNNQTENSLDAKNGCFNENQVVVLKFLKIHNQCLIKNNLNKLLFNKNECNNDYFKSIIFISKSSLPVCEEIHNNPNYPIIPSYFVCTNKDNEKTFIAFDDYNGLVVL
ncbi:hypothetical protein RS030_111931 [Cryptosporidium xiaoi]|uniref:ABC transporter domain-containing protein n=1 Tax=Cryptosporidium xiaoi TaxID=659607 RepID=A0AAV9Y2H4_9CRYT